MTTSTQHSTSPATPKQLRYLSRLAEQRGVTYTRPTSRADASRQIKDLLAMKPASIFDRLEDDAGVRAGFESWGGATAVRPDELQGYGSTAGWSTEAPDDED